MSEETNPAVQWAGGAFIVSDDPMKAGMVDEEGRLTERGANALNASRRGAGLMTLTEFLTARLDEDEAEMAYLDKSDQSGPEWGEVNERNVVFIGPGRVLAEAEAKRRFLAAGEALESPWEGCGDECEWLVWEWGLRLLALPYADHPDYRQEWKP